MKSQDLQSQSPDTASLTKDSMDEVLSISKALGVHTHLIRVIVFSQEEMTAKADNQFLDGTGSLLFLWNRGEAEDLVKSICHPQHDSKLTHTTEVFAISAVGTYCDADTPLAWENFLHLFLYMLSWSLRLCDICYMRLIICLAICRFTNCVHRARQLMCKRLMLSV
jgi:hypothetical protein